MSNPARDLADLLNRWQVPDKQTILKVRAAAAGKPAAGRTVTAPLWRYINRAATLLEELEAALDELEAAGKDVGHYRVHLPAVYRAVYRPEAVWSQTTNALSENMQEPQIASLLLIADVIDGLPASGLTDQRLALLLERLQQAHDIASNINSGTSAKDHLVWQIDQAIHFAKHPDLFGRQTVIHATATATNSTLEYAEEALDLTEDERRLLRQVGRDLLVNLVASGLFQGGLALAEGPVGEAIKAITQ